MSCQMTKMEASGHQQWLDVDNELVVVYEGAWDP